MGGTQAASVLSTVKRTAMEAKGDEWKEEEEEAFKVHRIFITMLLFLTEQEAYC